MNPDLLRYSCQMALPGFDEEKQLLLQNARVLIAGAGGLGCPAAQYLTAAGVGTLGIADFDVISVSNLHRQVLYNPSDAGEKKVIIACQRLQLQNPGIELVPHDMRITSQNVLELIAQYDIIIDGTDNFETRFLLNDAAVLSGKPVVYGAIYQFDGQVAIWNVKNEKDSMSPNYRDVFPKVNASQIPNCAEGGVIPTLAGIIGCMQANEVIKYITQTGDLLVGKMLIFDAQTMQSRIIKLSDITDVVINRLVPTVDIATITAIDLKKAITEETISMIDVRTEEEHEEFNIGGQNIPLDDLDQYEFQIGNNEQVVLYCASGKRSGEGIKLLKAKYPRAKIFSLEGGLAKWNID